jgi:Fusaric acid resistance protein-like
MWAVIATVFVYRDSQTETFAAAISRMAATAVSLALCLVYLLIAPSHPWALAVLIALVTLAGRPGDSITTGITIAVVMVVAELEPRNAWERPEACRHSRLIVGAALVSAWLYGIGATERSLLTGPHLG